MPFIPPGKVHQMQLTGSKMQHQNSFPGGISGGVLIFVLITIILIIFQFRYQSVLNAASPNEGAIMHLRWTAPGDDGSFGRASKYDIRYSLYPITEQNWNLATQVENEPYPHTAGAGESCIVTGLELNSEYYFAMKTADEVFNWSDLSNLAQAVATSTYSCGDATGDGRVNISDVITIVNYIFLGGDILTPIEAADANCDTSVNVGDAVYITNYIFLGGPSPCDTNQDGTPDC